VRPEHRLPLADTDRGQFVAGQQRSERPSGQGVACRTTVDLEPGRPSTARTRRL
jgi:hypothetical protein